MYSKFQLGKKYLQYYFTASSGKGHGVHSPFVFDFIKKVLRDNAFYDCYPVIETARKNLLQQKREIEVEDLGAGSSVTRSAKRVVAAIAASSLKPAKYAQLLFRIVHYYKPVMILELGTSFGITTSYLASGNALANVHTIEGSKAIGALAANTFERVGIKNIRLTTGDFNHVLPMLLPAISPVNLSFIDGNHRKEPTLNYFEQLLNHSTDSSIFIFDDIHWSPEMEEAWTSIKANPAVTLTIDLFFIGIVFINPDFKTPQHFVIRF